MTKVPKWLRFSILLLTSVIVPPTAGVLNRVEDEVLVDLDPNGVAAVQRVRNATNFSQVPSALIEDMQSSSSAAPPQPKNVHVEVGVTVKLNHDGLPDVDVQPGSVARPRISVHTNGVPAKVNVSHPATVNVVAPSDSRGTANSSRASASSSVRPAARITSPVNATRDIPRDSSVARHRSSSGDLRETSRGEPQGYVMVDAGSSGSKLFSFCNDGKKEVLKVFTRCTFGIEQPCQKSLKVAEMNMLEDLLVKERKQELVRDEPAELARIKARIEGKCEDEMLQLRQYALKGLSVLGYNQDKCKAIIFLQGEPLPSGDSAEDILSTLQADEDVARYADILLGRLKTHHEGNTCPSAGESSAPLSAQPKNREAVPILATAGMRLLPKKRQEKVWRTICGHTGKDGYAFASEESGDCGTISGTREAYLEFLAANEKRAQEAVRPNMQKKRLPVVTVTIGGESAQISIPLKGQTQLNLFAIFFDKVRAILNPPGSHMNCEQVVLPSEWHADGRVVRFTKAGPGEARMPIRVYNNDDCTRDFVDIREMPPNLQDEDFKYVGLISMLGLQRLTGGIGIAGGMNAIEKWAKNPEVLCHAATDKKNTANEDYVWEDELNGRKGCKSKLEDALMSDAIYRGAKEFFSKIPSWDGVHFIFGTLAVIPSKRFNSTMGEVRDGIEKYEKEDTDEQKLKAWVQLMQTLDDQVRNHKNKRFGINGEQTPIKTLYAYKYWQILGLDPPSLSGFDVLKVTRLMDLLKTNSLHFETVDWTEGKLREMADIQDNTWPHQRMDPRVFNELIRKTLVDQGLEETTAEVNMMKAGTVAPELLHVLEKPSRPGSRSGNARRAHRSVPHGSAAPVRQDRLRPRADRGRPKIQLSAHDRGLLEHRETE